MIFYPFITPHFVDLGSGHIFKSMQLFWTEIIPPTMNSMSKCSNVATVKKQKEIGLPTQQSNLIQNSEKNGMILAQISTGFQAGA